MTANHRSFITLKLDARYQKKHFRSSGMYQPDSWYAVIFEMLLVGFSLYNSLRMTTWYNIVAQGTAVAVNGPGKAPSVADHFGIRSNTKKSRSCGKGSLKSRAFEMGDRFEVAAH